MVESPSTYLVSVLLCEPTVHFSPPPPHTHNSREHTRDTASNAPLPPLAATKAPRSVGKTQYHLQEQRVSEIIADFIENSPREVQISQLRAGRRASSQYTEEEDFLCRGSTGLPFCLT